MKELKETIKKLEQAINGKGGGGQQWRSWLRQCATSRKVVGSIPHGVIEIFHT